MQELSPQTLLIICPLAIVLLGIILHLFYSSKINVLKQSNGYLTDTNELLSSELKQERDLLAQQESRKQELREYLSTAEADLRNLQTKYDELINDDKTKLEKFENIANRVLKMQSHTITEKQEKGMKDILDPLKEKIKSFEEKVERTSKEYIKSQVSMKEQIYHLAQQSEKVSRDAHNLTKALKGDFKKQGNWGELILESILDKSGLEKGREYFVQVSKRDHEGAIKKPDVVIQLPDGKRMIIDSKVSLIAYEASVNAVDDNDRESNAKAHSLALKKHIDDLSSKDYHDLYQVESPDFVLMFVPIDSAFTAALKYNNDLYAYGYDKNIIIVTPSTLLATLKTVETLWRNEKHNTNALEIATEAGKMYDKLVGFVEDMNRLGNQLNTVNTTFNASMNKLNTGSGNLIKRAEKLKSLGAKANKTLDKSRD